MKIIETTFERLPRERLVIGFEGENLRATVRIDCTSVFAEYPNATPALIVKPLFADAYPVVVDRNGTDVDWLITSEILSFTGDGEIQLTFVKDQVICKSAIAKIRVSRSLQVTGEMPDPVVQWIENANRKLAEVDAQIVELEGMVDTATDAATRAEQSASTASTKAEQAAGSAATATAKATEATNAAGTATAKAAEAQTAAQTATNEATAAAESERIATSKAVEATTAAGTATAKAEQATEAAQTATEKAGDASASATAAHASEINAAESADDALSAEVGANAAKRAAEASATQAATSAQGASTDAQTAAQKAAEATQSATNAAASATSAATSAETASTKAGEAAASAQAVAETAEQLADSLEQIEQNTQDIADLDERKANVDGYYPDMTVGNAEQLNSSKYVENSEPYTLRTSGGTSDIGNREYLDAVVGGTVAWNQKVRDEASENETDFAPIVTVTDAVEDAAGVKVKIEPVQDLHGYDHPWPAGGGKNLLQVVATTETINGVSFTVNADGTVLVNGTATEDTRFAVGTWVATGEQIVFSGCPSGGSTSTYRQFADYIGSDVGSSGWTATPAAGSNCAARIQIYGGTTINNLLFRPMIRLASETDATFAPYSNICPITGWDGVQVWDDPAHGGNVEWNQQCDVLTIGGDTSDLTFTWGRNGAMTISGTSNKGDWKNIKMFTDKSDHLMLAIASPEFPEGFSIGATYDYYRRSHMFMLGTGNQYLRFAFLSGTVMNYEGHINIFDLTQMFGEIKANEIYALEQATYGAGLAYFKALFPNDYYPYNAGEVTTVSAVNGNPYRHYSITLPSEAGTVYGGELTVNADGSGELAVDRASVDMGTLTWGLDGNQSHRFLAYNSVSAKPTGDYSVPVNSICNIYKSLSQNALFNGTVGFSIQSMNGKSVYVYDDKYTDAAALKAALQASNAQLVYELASPQTFSLTASQIRTLLGQNNIWADTGDLALTYTGTDEHLTLESGKKYLSRISGTDSMLLGSGQEITAAKGTDNVFDLTQMFGTAVADYVYGQGASFFRKWFPNARYPYNAGELRHVEGLSAHEMVGFNQWDEEWELGSLNFSTGATVSSSTTIRSKNFYTILPDTIYYSKSPKIIYGFYYDSEQAFIVAGGINNSVFRTPTNARYMKIIMEATTYNHDICISLAHNGSRNGEYEPYEKHSYPLDSSVILRGIPKVGASGVYWDGDRYLPDGTVKRRYREVKARIVCSGAYRNQLGVWCCSFKLSSELSATSKKSTPISDRFTSFPNKSYGDMDTDGIVKPPDNMWIGIIALTDTTSGLSASSTVEEVQLAFTNYVNAQEPTFIYELATPTTETAQPYHSTQWVSDWGTEEFVSTGIVPVGHETRYPANLRDKLQHLPDAASGNGSYLITQTDGQMVLTPFPAPPSTAGNYVLKATVVNGVATYTWEVAT